MVFPLVISYVIISDKPNHFLFASTYNFFVSYHFHCYHEIFISCHLPGITDPNSLCERLKENKLEQMESAHVNDCPDLICKDVKISNDE